jgi:hypothetical protein
LFPIAPAIKEKMLLNNIISFTLDAGTAQQASSCGPNNLISQQTVNKLMFKS